MLRRSPFPFVLLFERKMFPFCDTPKLVWLVVVAPFTAAPLHWLEFELDDHFILSIKFSSLRKLHRHNHESKILCKTEFCLNYSLSSKHIDSIEFRFFFASQFYATTSVAATVCLCSLPNRKEMIISFTFIHLQKQRHDRAQYDEFDQSSAGKLAFASFSFAFNYFHQTNVHAIVCNGWVLFFDCVFFSVFSLCFLFPLSFPLTIYGECIRFSVDQPPFEAINQTPSSKTVKRKNLFHCLIHRRFSLCVLFELFFLHAFLAFFSVSLPLEPQSLTLNHELKAKLEIKEWNKWNK